MQFSGHERDDHIPEGAVGTTDDLDYMHARYYNPQIGRFLRVDPARIRSTTRIPLRWNQYAYSLARPLTTIDPDGRDPATAVAGAELLVFTGGGSTGAVAGGVAAGGAVVIVGGASVVVGRAIGNAEIGGKTIDDRISDALSEVILAVTSRNKPVAPGRDAPSPQAIPGAGPKETAIPVPEEPTADQPPTSEELAEQLVDKEKKERNDALVKGIGKIFGTPADDMTDDI